MALMFTERHRKQFGRDSSDPQYHGDACEAVYNHGMELLREHKRLTLLIGAKRRTRMGCKAPLTKRSRKQWIEDKTLANEDTRPIAVLIARFKEVAVLLKLARMNYTDLHTRRHGFTRPSYFHWRD
ncbi:hypothetical protein MPK64_gp279 [Erwinia phage pEa_SNUABM_16]|uniref:Uncharacterized protein n=1 Tax=Erwinia phage pEa_SNUABM_16 TaxID=2869544 RepID=A0AAE9BV45_9CAUD|nr:hypothetical protein MPK64_gp279 [Erwinia phage pEa_SNUABM_16]UAW96423.1 hypothetical protein pEaSNUABM16_00279 [Erwinia phage pEa_SNUABM_16]